MFPNFVLISNFHEKINSSTLKTAPKGFSTDFASPLIPTNYININIRSNQAVKHLQEINPQGLAVHLKSLHNYKIDNPRRQFCQFKADVMLRQVTDYHINSYPLE